jgi:predicted transcriptional regulator
MCNPAGSETVDRVEIRIVLEAIDPPAGHLQVTASARQAHDDPGQAGDEMPEVSFTGWLDLMRALSVVTGSG